MKNNFLNRKCFIGAVVMGIVTGVTLTPILRNFLEPKLASITLGALVGIVNVLYCDYFNKEEK